jgi:hypothetical protein
MSAHREIAPGGNCAQLIFRISVSDASLPIY